MKRNLCTLVIVLLGAILCCCGNSQEDSKHTDKGNNKNGSATNELERNEGNENTDGLGNKGMSGNWFVEDYVDDFGDSTGSSFCYTVCDGTFENTATSGSDLIASVYFDSYNEVFAIRLLEYSKAKASYLSNAHITLKCKVDDYVFEDMLIGNPPNGDLILSNGNAGYKKIFKYLDEGKEIRTVIYIDNSKYNFTISGNGFAEALAEQEAKKKQAGISGTYKNAILSSEDWFVIKQETPTSGTITAASKSGSATLDYTYDPSTYILKVVPDKDWEYRCVYDTFLVYDIVMTPEYGTVKGTIPDGDTFDAAVTWFSPKNKATTTYVFRNNGTFVESGTNFKGEKTGTKTGTYIRAGSFIMQKYSKGYVWTDYIYNGKLYRSTDGVYVIDR